MSSWKQVRFSEICDITRGGSPRPIQEYMTNDGVPWIKISDATASNSRFIEKTKEFIKTSGISKSREVFPDDLILSNSATPGIPKFMRIYACIHDGWLLLRNFNGAEKEFIYWLLLNERDKLIQQGNGSVFTNLKTDILKNHIVNIPDDIEEQKRIATILNNIQEKIELNTQINQTLEQIAQTIFKSWFIDFDPVHAKANALASGQTAEQATQAAMAVISGKNTQELHRLQTANPEQYQQLWEIAEAFPSGFDEEGVPRGWIRGNIGAITKAKRLKVGCVDAIVLSAVSSSELIRSDELFTKQVYSKSIEKYLQVHLWDFAYNPSRINIGSIGLLKENIIGAVSPVYEVFSVKEKYHWFLEKILSLEYTKKYIQTLASGSVRQSLKLSELQTIPCVIPNEFIMDLFNSYYISFLDYITNNEKQNTTLSNIRDELLPKLLSGELD